MGLLVERADDEFMKPDEPEIAVDGFEADCMPTEGLGKKDILRMPAQNAITHDVPLLPVQRILRLARPARKRPRGGLEATSGTLLSNALVGTFHVVDTSKAIEEDLLLDHR